MSKVLVTIFEWLLILCAIVYGICSLIVKPLLLSIGFIVACIFAAVFSISFIFSAVCSIFVIFQYGIIGLLPLTVSVFGLILTWDLIKLLNGEDKQIIPLIDN